MVSSQFAMRTQKWEGLLSFSQGALDRSGKRVHRTFEGQDLFAPERVDFQRPTANDITQSTALFALARYITEDLSINRGSLQLGDQIAVRTKVVCCGV